MSLRTVYVSGCSKEPSIHFYINAASLSLYCSLADSFFMRLMIFFFFFFFFSQKTRFDISCKLLETVCIKCQILCSGKRKIFNLLSAENFTRVLSVKYITSKTSSHSHYSDRGLASTSLNSIRPSCWKLTMSLVNDSLKFTSSDTQIC